MKEFKNVFLNQLLTRIKTVAHPWPLSREGRGEQEGKLMEGVVFGLTRLAVLVRHCLWVRSPAISQSLAKNPLAIRNPSDTMGEQVAKALAKRIGPLLLLTPLGIPRLSCYQPLCQMLLRQRERRESYGPGYRPREGIAATPDRSGKVRLATSSPSAIRRIQVSEASTARELYTRFCLLRKPTST